MFTRPTNPRTCEKNLLTHIVMMAGGLLSVIVFGIVVARAESFDKPLHKTVLDLGRSQYLTRNDTKHVTITCFYYPRFMVKQKIDPGLKGAELIAITPVQPGHIPKCARAHQLGEKEFKEQGEKIETSVAWNGYFTG
jgi:hypothetical protein